ncbi:hypothetical protein [Stappia sp.]|uniref:hypothetical protein n=1 Tax=Stappia sp. TaxID=1870903 RepID=UPI0032D9954D
MPATRYTARLAQSRLAAPLAAMLVAGTLLAGCVSASVGTAIVEVDRDGVATVETRSAGISTAPRR